jgi:hypothetical protein
MRAAQGEGATRHSMHQPALAQRIGMSKQLLLVRASADRVGQRTTEHNRSSPRVLRLAVPYPNGQNKPGPCTYTAPGVPWPWYLKCPYAHISACRSCHNSVCADVVAFSFVLGLGLVLRRPLAQLPWTELPCS